MTVLNDNHFLKNAGYSNYQDTLELARHRWYYYKEGFSPLLVEKAIEEVGLKKNEVLLDPFNGSGTTTLVASILGYKSYGIEVNPFTAFLSQVKGSSPSHKEIRRVEGDLIKNISKGKHSDLIGFSTFSETDVLEKWLFNSTVLRAFEGGWQHSNQIKSPGLKKVIRLALIISAMENCNATRDGKCLRYRENWKSQSLDKYSFGNSFRTILDRVASDIESQPIAVPASVICGDARESLKRTLKVEKFKLCITSPPYLNTFDYTDIYRPELLLGKFVNSSEELYKLRLRTVRSHLQAKWEKPVKSDFGLLYSQAISHLGENQENLMDKKIPLMIQAYFEDMYEILKLLRVKALKDAQLWLVVSNSAYADMEIPVDLIIADVGCKAGWYLREVAVLRYIKRRKTRHSPNINELRESVIVFSASKI